MSKVCIFFGAGAEASFRLSGGQDFASSVLGRETLEMNSAIKTYYGSIKDEWCPRYIATGWKERQLLNAAIRKSILDFGEECMGGIEKMVKSRIKATPGKDEQNKIIRENTSYMGLIDERFHSLIAPKVLGAGKFWSVVDCYTRAYLLLAGQIIREDGEDMTAEKYLHILRNPGQTMAEIHDRCRNKPAFQNASYYSIARESGRDISIVTSNYTPCCADIMGLQMAEIAYIHGRMGLFESPHEWRMYDAEEEALPVNRVTFPYMSIQSGVKPVIEERQLQEYAKMLRYFDEADKIVIVGYRLNSDDNHINGILRSQIVRKGKEVVYLDYDSGSSDERIRARLRIDETQSSFIRKPIDGSNWGKVFGDEL